MKILTANNLWIGQLFEQISSKMIDLGHEVIPIYYKVTNSILKKMYLNHIVEIQRYLKKKEVDAFNSEIFAACEEMNPDLLFVMNESAVRTDTLSMIKKNTNCKTAVWIADNPFDSSRFTFLPLSLKYYDYIFVSDGIWIPSIQMVASSSRIKKIPSGGGFDSDLFYDDPLVSWQNYDDGKYACDVAFTGESYHQKAEGTYRARILEEIAHFNLKIWGDVGWVGRFMYHPVLQKAYQGGRLSYPELRKLYKTANIIINMPAPQILSGFQPRLFEIAACKGFQLVDWRPELDEIFNEDELVTFRTIPELLEKVQYFLERPERRIPYIDKLYHKVWNNYKWENTLKMMFDFMGNSD